jgi:predicted component of viral defense system (DUF524 family)
MTALFFIETADFQLEWRELSRKRSRVSEGQFGLFRIRLLKHRTSLSGSSWKLSSIGSDRQFSSETGPALFEETDYQIYLRAIGSAKTVRLQHRDPLIVRHLAIQESGQVQHGVINFHSQAGQTAFTISVNGRPYAILELEVFPTKMDYQTDFKSLIADLQQHAQGVVWEYLRSTVHGARTVPARTSDRQEWLLILRGIIETLGAAVRYISSNPSRRLDSDQRLLRTERVRRVDSGLRRQIERASLGETDLSWLGHPIPERLRAASQTATLNTSEHRWLRWQLTGIQRKLAELSTIAVAAGESERGKTIVRELLEFRQQIGMMLKCEPLRCADARAGIAAVSMQLLQAPGYREAFQCCEALRLGLSLEGDTFRLSVKDLNALYENWVLIAVLQIIRELTGNRSQSPQRLVVQATGLSPTLARGREQTFRFQWDAGRRVEVVYNPQFQNPAAMLIPQRPDVLIRLIHDDWPPVQIILDAKYRIDTSPEYQRQFGCAGPPVDAINVLHRYRDAILECGGLNASPRGIRRAVVHAAAIFPGTAGVCHSFRDSRLWESLDRFGIGAIPALPHDLSLLREWLHKILRESGWEIAERVIPHSAITHHTQLKQSARNSALVQVLDSADGQRRFDWIRRNQKCYVRMPQRPHRHFQIGTVAFYCSPPLEQQPAIAWKAQVLQAEVVERSAIATPWTSRHAKHSSMILYHLGPVVRLDRPIANVDPSQTSFRSDRWTTQLALDRAVAAAEICLETESEWKLYEALKSRHVEFRLRLDLISRDPDDMPRGRTWFLLSPNHAVRFDGANGFLQVIGTMQRFTSLEAIVNEAISGRDPSA